MAVGWKGTAELKAALLYNAKKEAAKQVIKQNAAELQSKMMRKTGQAFVKGYSVGDTKKSIRITIKDDGLTAAVGPTTEYSPYVEFGTRFMEAEPFVLPSLKAQEPVFLADMKKITK